MYGEGPQRGIDRDYLAKPFIYYTRNNFKPKQPKSPAVVLPPFVFVGKGITLEGVLVLSPGYQPQWFTNLWSIGSERKLQLTSISNTEWSSLLEKTLSPLVNDTSHIKDECSFWDIPTPCNLEIRFNKKERELTRSFLQQDIIENR